MKVVIQTVKYASCKVNDELIGKCDKGYLLLVGFSTFDDIKIIEKMALKVAKLRVFEDENGKMNLNLKDIGGSILSISQFTLYADSKKGNRPSFIKAKKGDEEAIYFYKYFNDYLRDLGFKVEEGIFGAHMEIQLLNDGPKTFILEMEEA